MNPWHLSASDLLIWGIVVHLICDWPLQNDWMANNKAKRRDRRRFTSVAEPPEIEQRWWDRHPAAYVHAGIHTIGLSLVFGFAGWALGLLHLLIDTRVPVMWWSKLMRQTQPEGLLTYTVASRERQLYDIGLEVRFWTDQVFHIACIAIAALVVA